jgi:hypothetical protein
LKYEKKKFYNQHCNVKLRINKNEKKKVNEKKKNNKTLIDYYIIVLFSKKMVSHNELYILLTEQKQKIWTEKLETSKNTYKEHQGKKIIR